MEANGTCLSNNKEKLSRAAVERLEMIQPLLDDDRAITDENVRRELMRIHNNRIYQSLEDAERAIGIKRISQTSSFLGPWEYLH